MSRIYFHEEGWSNACLVLTRSRGQIEEVLIQARGLSRGQQFIQSGLERLDDRLKKLADNFFEVPEMIAEARRISEAVRTELCALSILGRLGNTNQRYWDVTQADSHTFHWILEEDFESEYAFPIQRYARKQLRSWLSSGNGMFHISGKPGSGKSTLMKYLVQHPTVVSSLQEWACPKRLALGKFFFWKPDRGQNSREALITGLLYSIIHYDASLVYSAFPKCSKESFEQLSLKSNLHMTKEETSEAFNNLLNNSTLSERFNFCFFIDGLDEIDEDNDATYSEVVRMLQTWADGATGFVKICVSSRHVPVFDNMPVDHRIRLHDLTKYDIISFVQHSLQCHPIFRAQREVNDEDCEELIGVISQGADGVFLWVKLVLRSVERGLSNADSIAVLRERVRRTPQGLEDLFKNLLDSIEDCHAQMAVLLLAVAMSLMGDPECLPFALSLSMCRHFFNAIEISAKSGIDTVFQAANRPQSLDLTTEIVTSTRSKVYFRCKGLLDAVPAHPGDMCANHIGGHVEFLHRSIPEFLKTWIPVHMVSHGIRISHIRNAMCWLLWAETNFFNASINPQNLSLLDQADLRSHIRKLAFITMVSLKVGATFAPDYSTAFELLDRMEDALLPHLSVPSPHETGYGGNSEGRTWNTIGLVPEYLCSWSPLPLLAAAEIGFHAYICWKLAKSTPSAARSIYFQHCLVHVLKLPYSLPFLHVTGWIRDYTQIFQTLIQTADADINAAVPRCCGQYLLWLDEEDGVMPSVFDTLWIRILFHSMYKEPDFHRDAFHMIESLLVHGGLPRTVLCVGRARDWFDIPPAFSDSPNRAQFDNIDRIPMVSFKGCYGDRDDELRRLQMICGQDDGIITLEMFVIHAKPSNVTTLLSLIERNVRFQDERSAGSRELSPADSLHATLLGKHGVRRDCKLLCYSQPSYW